LILENSPLDIWWVILSYACTSCGEIWILTNSLSSPSLYSRLIPLGRNDIQELRLTEIPGEREGLDSEEQLKLSTIVFALANQCWQIADWLIFRFKFQTHKNILETVIQDKLLNRLDKPGIAKELIRFFDLRSCSDAWLSQIAGTDALILAKDFHEFFKLSPFEWEKVSALLTCVKNQYPKFCFWLRQIGVSLESLDMNYISISGPKGRKVIHALCGPPPHFGIQEKIYLLLRK